MLLHLQWYVLPVLLLVQVVSLYFKIFNQFIPYEFVPLSWNACKILTTVGWGFTAHSMKEYPTHYW